MIFIYIYIIYSFWLVLLIIEDEDPIRVFFWVTLHIHSRYMMKEYASGGSTEQEQYFGLKLCSARFVIQCAFGRLKARFGCLRRAMDININDLPHVIYACFVQHNFCEINNESINEERVQASRNYDRQFQPDTQPCGNKSGVNRGEAEGKKVRQILTKYFDP